MKTFQSCIIFGLLLLVGLAEPVGAFASTQPTGNCSWPLNQTLQAPDASQSDIFGFSVAVDGNIAVVGAPFHDEYGEDAGAAYVYIRSEYGQWEFEQELHASYTDDTDAGDFFGKYVCVRQHRADRKQ